MIRMLLATLLLPYAASSAWAQAKADARDDLRYGDQPFSYWESFPRTELKPERRIDALRAMAAFGSSGYAKEAAAVIVGVSRKP